MLGWAIIEGHQYLAIRGQAFRSFEIFGLVRFDEVIESFFSPLPARRHPDFTDAPLGLFLGTLGQFVEHIGCLMPPAPLPPGLAINLNSRFPETQCPIADGQPGAFCKPS